MGHLDFNTVGSGAFIFFTLLSIAGVLLGCVALMAAIALFGSKKYRWLALALIPAGLIIGIGTLVPGAVNQLTSEQALQASARQTYGVNLTQDQADALLAFPKTIFNAQRVQDVKTNRGTVALYGATTIARGNQVVKVCLYEAANGTHHLGVDSATLTELPKRG